MADPLAIRPLLEPLVVLVLWTFVMWAWLYATRIPAVRRGRVRLLPDQTREQFNARLPAAVRWKADNYNHLLEQPVLFYAVVLALAALGAVDAWNVGLAWTYVGLRVAHSLVQALVNVIVARFALFMAASIALLALTLRLAGAVLGAGS
jgi:hypothetical protein